MKGGLFLPLARPEVHLQHPKVDFHSSATTDYRTKTENDEKRMLRICWKTSSHNSGCTSKLLKANVPQRQFFFKSKNRIIIFTSLFLFWSSIRQTNGLVILILLTWSLLVFMSLHYFTRNDGSPSFQSYKGCGPPYGQCPGCASLEPASSYLFGSRGD